MRAWRCTVCKKAVTEQDLRNKNGAVIERKVYCGMHIPGQEDTEEAATVQVRRPAAPTEQAPGTSRVRRSRRDPAETENEPEAVEARTGRPVALIAGLGSVIAVLIIVVVVIMAGSKAKGAQAPVITPQAATGYAVPEKGDSIPADTAVVPEDNTDAALAASAGKADELPGEFARVMAQAEDLFDGSPSGFERGAKLVQEGIIAKRQFKGSDFPEQAENFLKERRAEVDAVIQVEFDAVRKKAMGLMNELKHKQALAGLTGLPAAFRAFGDWPERVQALEEELRQVARSQYEAWISDAQAKVKEGRREVAAATLKEIKAAAEGLAFDEIMTRLTRDIGLIEAGAEADGAAGADAAAGLLAQADAHFRFGRLPQAEELYAGLQKNFSADPAVAPELTRIAERLEKIAALKAMGRDDELHVQFWEDFETASTSSKHGTFWKSGTRQQVKTFAKSGYAIKLVPDAEFKYGAVGLRGGVPSDMAAWLHADNSYFAFYYLLEAKQPSAKAHRFAVQCMNRTQSDNFHYELNAPAFDAWTFACVPVAEWEDNEHKGKKPQAGNEWTSISVNYGSQGENATLYIDNICVVSGSSLYYLQDKIKAKTATIAEISSDPDKDWYTMDIRILENMIARAGTDRRRSDILVVGGLHAGSQFLSGISKDTKGKLVKAKGTGSPTVTLDDFVASVPDEIASKKPGVAVIFTGINDIINTRSLEGLQDKYQKLVDAALEKGTLPVLVTMPATFNEEFKKLIPDVNVAIVNVARMNDLPFIDCFMMFSGENVKDFYKNEMLLKRAGYDRLNDAFVQLYLILEKYALK